MWKVFESKKTIKELDSAPQEIQREYEIWKDLVSTSGPQALRSFPGYRDHALKGEWTGARSSYLNIKWRVIYTIQLDQVRVMVLKITPHDYRRK